MMTAQYYVHKILFSIVFGEAFKSVFIIYGQILEREYDAIWILIFSFINNTNINWVKYLLFEIMILNFYPLRCTDPTSPS